eukprot:1433767-Pyramimonas_sp.AAC.1
MGIGSLQMAPRRPQRAPRGPQEGPKRVPRAPRPRALQERPRDAIFESPRGRLALRTPLLCEP